MTSVNFTDEAPTALTDAQWAANQAALAFQHGRMELGEAFGRIALRAHIAQLHRESTTLPVTGTPHFDAVNSSGADLNLFDASESLHTDTVPTGRCRALITRPVGPNETNTTECHAATWFNANPDGKGGIWRHVDPEVDKLHWPDVVELS
jgi:hypothetical protein